VHYDFLVEFQLGGSPQRLAQNLRFKAKLGRIGDVLILAAAASKRGQGGRARIPGGFA
jgi:hypothetical protein